MTRDAVELTCREVVELVTDYLSHALPAESRARLEQHLFTCPPCTTYLHQMRVVVAAAGELAREPPAEPDVQAALGVFERWKQK